MVMCAVHNGAVPRIVGALTDRVHIPGAGRAVQQRGGVRGGSGGWRGRRHPAPRVRRRAAPQGAAHLPVPRRRCACARRGT